ncbi:hypothetical protein OG458_42495 (plasmid) [Streptomyces sp. NBC_01281]|uniref:hypothetical protein n=1 Tax=Streptomyces sp. NBC_01281 TaxID=2903811 RepID=UPI002E0F73A5|nr:hypothetical protein OG458_41310 [Streptomyces sp. NBC_01281]WSK66625.1 hypothetical protein OG458_42495 [Streptomyces sp. NBC_01281]
MRNTNAFKDAVAETLAELARLGVTVRPGAVADVIEANMTKVAAQMGVQERSAWRYFSAAGLAEAIARQHEEFEDSSGSAGVGEAPMPPVDNPELALILAGVPDSLMQTGGDLYAMVINVAVNAWMAGHIHGEDGCEGCEGSRGPSGHDWNDRMKQITAMSPDITKWFDRDRWTAALHDSGFSVERR